MANRKRAEARRKAQAKSRNRSGDGASGDGGSGGGGLGTWIAIGALLVVVAVGGTWALTKSDDSDGGGTDNTAELNLIASQPVTVTGEELSLFDSADSVDPAVGLPAPTLSGLDFEGDAIAIDPAVDGAYMVVFLAHWCPHCNAEVPRLLDWKGSGSVPAELNVIGVATAVSESAPNYPPAEWFSNKGWSWPVLVDESLGDGQAGKAAAAYGASGWPYFVIVGADGLVKARVSGEVEVTELQVIVDDALAG